MDTIETVRNTAALEAIRSVLQTHVLFNVLPAAEKRAIELLLEGGQARFLLGTDELGRDTLARVLYGARISLSAGLVSVALAMVSGTFFGLPSSL